MKDIKLIQGLVKDMEEIERTMHYLKHLTPIGDKHPELIKKLAEAKESLEKQIEALA